MRHLKLIDFWIQVILIAGCLFYALISPNFILTAYFLVGGWQFTSYLIHEFSKDNYYASSKRKYYGRVLLAVFILGVLAIPVWPFYGMGLLIVYPFLAIWYATICYTELRLLEYKTLIHLK